MAYVNQILTFFNTIWRNTQNANQPMKPHLYMSWNLICWWCVYIYIYWNRSAEGTWFSYITNLYIYVIFRRSVFFCILIKKKKQPCLSKKDYFWFHFVIFLDINQNMWLKWLNQSPIIKNYYRQSIKWCSITRSFQVKHKTELYCIGIGYNSLTSTTLIEIDWPILNLSDLF